MSALLDKLRREGALSADEWESLIKAREADAACAMAADICTALYGKSVFVRALIEITNCCKNDCYYCGIRKSNTHAARYRMQKDEVLECCNEAYALGMRTFVLQGGEDEYFTAERVCSLIRAIKEKYRDCAVTLSLGEKSRETYAAYRAAGAERYLLRHETADCAHYAMLHPPIMSLKNRMQCLFDLKALGFATGSGFMVGTPHQSAKTLARDMLFLESLNPDMIGIGPFMPQHDTPFGSAQEGSVELTLYLISLLRIAFPSALIPATTALGSAQEGGRERGLLAGANVIMPNFTPRIYREKYSLYDKKITSGAETAEGIYALREAVKKIDREIVIDRGDKRRCF